MPFPKKTMDSDLLVPIKVQALVIDDIVINKTGVIEIEQPTAQPQPPPSQRKYAANDGRWSPQLHDYQLLTSSLRAPGPRPFYGATRLYQGHQAEQLVLDAGSPALPGNQDRGVYLHWVLPSGLRHAYTPGQLDFPPLPDHWLIVRFSRRDAAFKTRAWFVDGGAVVSTGGASLLFAGTDKYVARRVGRVVPLEEFATTNFGGERIPTITALGNAYTGSPTFTAFLAENRNIFSWHDKLEDLREPNTEGQVPEGTALSYLLVGWYREQANEPLASTSVKTIEKRDQNDKLLGLMIDPPGWFIDTNSPLPDLLKRRSVFHGMVAHINYWTRRAYKGQILGYPGAPRTEGLGKAAPAFKVGVGNNAEDALVSLVSSEYSGEQESSSLAKEQPNLWKALEAVIYRQPESLVHSWNTAPRDNAVHQNWFATREAGKIWFIRPQENKEGVFPTKANETAEQTSIQPTPEQLRELKELNQAQADADAASRELAALQQELYARWWKLCGKSREFQVPLTGDEKDITKLFELIQPLRTKRDQLVNRLKTLPDLLGNKLPKGLELKYDASPRFWLPADPVIVVKNCGGQTKHQFPRPLPCRLPEQIITAGKVVVKEDQKAFSQGSGVAEIAAAAQQRLPSCPPTLSKLLDEGSIVEQAIADLAQRSLSATAPLRDASEWETWVERLVNDLTWDGKPETFPRDQITFTTPAALDIPPYRLAELWKKQPWSPLFLDWQITWFPSPALPATEDGFGPVWPLRNFDYVPPDRKSIPKGGFTMRGRSLISPIDGRIFDEPIDTLRELVQSKSGGNQRKDGKAPFPKAVTDVLSRYEVVWDSTLGELKAAGLMGQALTGFHQALLRRDISLPRITPDSTRPWIAKQNLKTLESEVKKHLDAPDQEGLVGERLSPPTPTSLTVTTFPFSMIRAGALRIDELWLVDDFGQSADLLGLTEARSRSSGQVFHPRMRWHDDPFVMAMPPRVLQPIRLNFRFAAAEDVANDADPALSSICGWIFYNPLDQALVLCNRNGELVGDLVIVRNQNLYSISWNPRVGGVALNNIRNESLKAFAQSLIETDQAKPRLFELLNLMDNSLQRIRPAAARRDTVRVGRPLALVNATIGLELFGKAWADPHKPLEVRDGTGDPALDALRVRVNLGCLHNVEDGLVGYFKANGYNRIVVGELPEKIKSSNYIGDPKDHAVRIGFGAPQRLTLLMDPWGSIQAACGLVPAKTITLAHAELDKTVAQMETSFRIGPVLLQAGRLALPTPAGDKGTWSFSGPLTNQAATTVVALDPKYFSDQPVVATEGRLLLLNEKK
jgi:hypothetical protein